MDLDRLLAYAGAGACVALLVVLAAPFTLLEQPGTGLGVYYQSGSVGAAGPAFLALVGIVVFLSGERGSADPVTVAGIAITLAVGIALLTLWWALAVDPDNVLSFTAAWMGWHRWLVVALSLLVLASAGAYAREVLRR
jgi:hypothetical protein